MLAAAVAQGFGRFTYGLVLPNVRDELLAGSNTVAGLLGTANTAAYLAGTVAVAWMSARLTPASVVRVFSVAGIAIASQAQHAAVLAVALILMGLGGAAIWIPSPGLATSMVSQQRRGLAVGMMGAGVGVGIVFSGQLANVVEQQDRSWRTVYGVHTAVGLAVLLLVYAVLRGRQDQRSAAGGFGGFTVLTTMIGWRPLTACYAVFGFGYLLVIAFFVARLTDDSGIEAGEASLLFTLMGASTVFGGIILGRISDRYGRRLTLTVGYLGFAGSTLLLLTGAYPWLFVGSIGVGVLFGGIATVITAYVVDHTTAATYGPTFSAATFAFGVAQVLSPQAGGALADWLGSFTAVFLLSAAVMASGALFALALPHDGPQQAR